MRTIITDLSRKDISKLNVSKDDVIFFCNECKNRCRGCFNCWVKHPTKCMYKDNYSNIVNYLKQSKELIIISKNRYGVYSSGVKKVVERCIGYLLPYLTIRYGRIHHSSRYLQKLNFKCYFYGNINNRDRVCLKNLVESNSINLNTLNYKVYYVKNIKELKNAFND